MSDSIRVRLTLWYAAILAVILGLFGWGLYSRVQADLSEAIDDMLSAQADLIADGIFDLWELEQREPPDTPEERRAEAKWFHAFVTHWARQTGGLEGVRPVRLFDPEGNPLAVSKSFSEMDLPLTEGELRQARLGRVTFETFRLSAYRVRLLTRPVMVEEGPLYIVQVATPLRQADASLAKLALWLVWLIPTSLIVISLVGWALVTRTLWPVKRITAQARRIGAEDLHERIEEPRARDEIGELARTFNEMLDRLERAFKRMRQFSGAASHELRTPLTVVLGELEWALRRPRSQEEYRRVLETSLGTVSEMATTLEALLSLAHWEALGRAVEWNPVELTAVVLEGRKASQAAAESKQIRIETQAEGPVWVQGEQRLLQQLLSNLLANAIRHTPPQGCITIRTGSQSKKAYLAVEDTGPGIPQEEMAKLFDRFFSHPSRAQADGSTGLGLGLCRWIAEIHRGRIDVASLAGEGATFTVWLPQVDLQGALEGGPHLNGLSSGRHRPFRLAG